MLPRLVGRQHLGLTRFGFVLARVQVRERLPVSVPDEHSHQASGRRARGGREAAWRFCHEINRTLTSLIHTFYTKVGPHIAYQRGIRAMAKNQEVNEEMRELIEESTSTSLLKELGALNRDRVNAAPNSEAAVSSDVNTLLERMSGSEFRAQ
jgi:hypothetical protein